jgi:thiamine transport system substrate-binding protein
MNRPRLISLSVAVALALASCSSSDDAPDGADTTVEGSASDETDAARGGSEADDEPATSEGSASDETDAARGGSAADDEPDTNMEPSTIAPSTNLTLVAYDSFPEEDTPVNEALASFSERTGIEVEVLIAGDTGAMVSKAALTAGNPEGDVMWGVDNTFLSRAVDEEIFEPYESPALDEVDPELTELVPEGEATPVDYGDVCINFDIGWFEERELEPTATLEDLTDPRYEDLLVVENPATSSPGMGFLLATIDQLGEDGWQDYWAALRDNGVLVVDGWTEAYYEQFTWTSDGDRPLVVGYASSPPAEVIFADPPVDEAPTGVMTETCFRQIEYAGVLRGTDHPDEARQLVDFLAGAEFQETVALGMFVYPANESVELPDEFVEFTATPDDPTTVDADTMTARARWIDDWTKVTLR